MFCDEECSQEKAFFATSISRETGKYFPYFYCPDYAASLDTYQPDVETMVVVLHGGASNGNTYLCRVQNSVRVHFGDNYNKVGVISMQFNTCYRDGKPDCNKGVEPESISNELYWKHSWYFGFNSTANFSKEISSFTVVDELLASFADSPHFPNLKRIKVLGYSGGANFFARYSVFGDYFDIISAAGRDIGNSSLVACRMQCISTGCGQSSPTPTRATRGLVDIASRRRSMQPFTPSQNLGPPAVATIIGPSVWREV